MQIRVFLMFLLSLFAAMAMAADQQTLLKEDRIRIRAYVEEGQQFYVGQQVRFFVEVVTDSWFTTAPRYPELRVPGAVAIDPERFSTNVTVRDGARTLNGQRHGYLIYPQRVGKVVTPALSVSFAVSVDGKPSELITLTSNTVSVNVVMPPGVNDVAKLLTSTKVQLSETYEPGLSNLKVGDSITRSVTVKADDLQALVLPPINFPEVEGMTAYPGEPQLQNSTNRGQYKAVRTDTITYIVEQAGDYAMPALELDWFNPDNARLQKLSLAARDFSAESNPDAAFGTALPAEVAATGSDYQALAGQMLEWLVANLQFISIGIGGLYVLVLARRRYRGAFVSYWLARRAAARVSEPRYFRMLQKACVTRDAKTVVSTFWRWMDVAGYSAAELEKYMASGSCDVAFIAEWRALNHALYSNSASTQPANFRAFKKLLHSLRKSLQGNLVAQRTGLLTSMNPGQ